MTREIFRLTFADRERLDTMTCERIERLEELAEETDDETERATLTSEADALALTLAALRGETDTTAEQAEAIDRPYVTAGDVARWLTAYPADTPVLVWLRTPDDMRDTGREMGADEAEEAAIDPETEAVLWRTVVETLETRNDLRNALGAVTEVFWETVNEVVWEN